MLNPFKKWQKVDDLPPIVDEIDILDNKNINLGNQNLQKTENILIFLNLKLFGVQELKAEIIDMSQIIEEFIKKICKKYKESINTNDVQVVINELVLEKKYTFKHYDIKSNSVVELKPLPQKSHQTWSFWQLFGSAPRPSFQPSPQTQPQSNLICQTQPLAQTQPKPKPPPQPLPLPLPLIQQEMQLPQDAELQQYVKLAQSVQSYKPVQPLQQPVQSVPAKNCSQQQSEPSQLSEPSPLSELSELNVYSQHQLKTQQQSEPSQLSEPSSLSELSELNIYSQHKLKTSQQSQPSQLSESSHLSDLSKLDIPENLFQQLSCEKHQESFHLRSQETNGQKDYQNNNNEQNISIISKNKEYQLSIKKNSNQINLRQVLEASASKEDIERSLILCNGEPISLSYDKTDLSNVQSIFLIDQQSGGIAIKFTLEINDQYIEDLSQFKDSLQWLDNSEINEFIQVCLDQINQNQQYQYYYQQIPLHCIIAIRLYTTNLIYRKLNSDLRTSDYQRWKKYLKCLMEGLRYMKYYKGVAYRGIRDYQNTTDYKKGKKVQWSEVSSVSVNEKVAQNFSNPKGMIFKVDLISAKDISNISIFEGEQELIMYPFSTFVVDEVQVKPNQPHIVTMRELPLPRSNQVLLWVDDNPENNYQFAQDLEKENNKICVIFCTSTKDAIHIIKQYKWMIYLASSQFRVVSDMVRIEEGQMNYNAGIELLCHLYQQMKYQNSTLIFCRDYSRAQNECTKQNIQGKFQITNDVLVLKKFLKFE